ncbi:MAG: metallophosphoesterase [Planctomycetota bacterium]|jgi:predicted phosphodiesterase
MNIIEKKIPLTSKSDRFFLYVIGDVHVGAFNCAESHFRKFVNYIKDKPNSYWIGGGDYTNCITPSDLNRYDVQSLANWIFTGDAMNIKEALLDIARQERLRFCEIVQPIKDKCIGLIMGNHEYSLMKHSHNGHHYIMCDELGVPNLTDAAFIRLRFSNKSSGRSATIIVMIIHGHGGGRTPGAEPNHLARLTQWAQADLILRGHSHTFRIEPSQPRLYIPHRGALPDELMEKEIFTANWGCWLKSYAIGPSTYDSRANYPSRPLTTLEITIKPYHDYRVKYQGRTSTRTKSLIMMSECPYNF